jgi:putative methyltransferase (TIGR04325 family)
MAYNGPIWEGVYHSFNEVPVEGSGHDGEIWSRRSLKQIEAVFEEAGGSSPLPPTSNYRESLLPLLTSLVYNKNGVRILDFGGGIGFAYYQTIYGLTRNKGIEYHIVERESVCKAGTDFFKTKQPRPLFFTELSQTEGPYDIIHLGSVIHYVEDWKQLLSQLCLLSRRYLLLVDVPAGNIPTFVTVQHYYGAKIPAWFFNIEEILRAIKSFGCDLIFKSVYQSTILGVEQDLPMHNFEHKYQLKRTCNLLAKKSGKELSY